MKKIYFAFKNNGIVVSMDLGVVVLFLIVTVMFFTSLINYIN